MIKQCLRIGTRILNLWTALYGTRVVCVCVCVCESVCVEDVRESHVTEELWLEMPSIKSSTIAFMKKISLLNEIHKDVPENSSAT